MQKLLLKKADLAELLGISEKSIDDQRKLKRFPMPLISKRWSYTQIEDYISQLEAYGEWNESRYVEAMQKRRAQMYPPIAKT